MFQNIKKTNVTKALAVLLGVAALAVGGSAIADAATSQSATTTPTATSTTTPSTPTTQTTPAVAMPEHGTAAHEDAETAVTGDAAAKAQAAAVKSVGSGTAGAVTTDMTGTGFETTVTKADGSTVEVHLDSSLNALQGHGGPGDHDNDGG